VRLREWWSRLSHRGEHRRNAVRPAASPHAAAIETRIEQRGAEQAQQRAAEVDRFMAEFRHAFGLNGEGTARR